jgi:glycosyltransferase involved in cell wall biosynthesis
VRILHVGWGFTPWRRGGLIHYAEDLMAAQVERGHDVGYFFSGRHYPHRSRPRLMRWRRSGVAMHEVINGPIVSGLELGTRYPELEVSEPWIEDAFRSALRDFRPDVVHVQELLCLPSSLTEVAAEEGVATVMTLQDYFPLCSTLRLFDADARLCTRLDVGEDCALRNAEAPATGAAFVESTLHYDIARARGRLPVRSGRRGELFEAAARRYYQRGMRAAERKSARARPVSEPGTLGAAFQRRRDVNVERLGGVGRLVPMSPRVAELYAQRGVSTERMTPMRLTLAHIEHLRARPIDAPPDPITFVTLGGAAGLSKGAQVIVGALLALRERGLEGRFRLRVLGGVDGGVRADLEGYRGVEIPELYEREQLDELLHDADVGIMPSIWEEAFGYSGVEMLAKGIPLIANPVGGIVEYAREGETAWLNDSCSGEGLADLMEMLVADPAKVVEMSARVIAARDELVLPMAVHANAIEGVYGDAIRRLGSEQPLP